MGAIFTYLKHKDPDENLLLDFENAKPDTEEETRVYNTVASVLERCSKILTQFREYEGCGAQIRKAIMEPTPENEKVAWVAVIPFVMIQKEWFDFGQELAKCVTRILGSLCLGSPKERLCSQQALAKQLADIFDFVLTFDEMKMGCPQLQNDFSFYRRTSGKAKQMDLELPIPVEIANLMSLFFAYPTPMMKCVSDASATYLGTINEQERANVTAALATMANICCNMNASKVFEREEFYIFSLRCMVGAIILYDHLHQQGAFVKTSPIQMKKCILTLRAYEPYPESLINAVKFTTIHCNTDTTPAPIQALLNQPKS